jgi:hypothetical protein
LLERAEQSIDVAGRQTAAFILNLEQDPVGTGDDPQRHAGARPGELESVLQEIHHDRRQHLPVNFDRQALLDWHDREGDAHSVGFQCCGRRQLVGESGHLESGRILYALHEADFVERSPNEIGHTPEAPLQYGTGAPGDAHIPRLEHFERDHRRVDQVSQFMRQEPEALAPARGLAIAGGLIPSAPELGDRPCDGIVKASVQHAKIIRADRKSELHRQVGDRLTDVAVIVHDL